MKILKKKEDTGFKRLNVKQEGGRKQLHKVYESVRGRKTQLIQTEEGSREERLGRKIKILDKNDSD